MSPARSRNVAAVSRTGIGCSIDQNSPRFGGTCPPAASSQFEIESNPSRQSQRADRLRRRACGRRSASPSSSTHAFWTPRALSRAAIGAAPWHHRHPLRYAERQVIGRAGVKPRAPVLDRLENADHGGLVVSTRRGHESGSPRRRRQTAVSAVVACGDDVEVRRQDDRRHVPALVSCRAANVRRRLRESAFARRSETQPTGSRESD